MIVGVVGSASHYAPLGMKNVFISSTPAVLVALDGAADRRSWDNLRAFATKRAPQIPRVLGEHLQPLLRAPRPVVQVVRVRRDRAGPMNLGSGP